MRACTNRWASSPKRSAAAAGGCAQPAPVCAVPHRAGLDHRGHLRADGLAARLPRDDPEHAEALGLLGRAYKQLFFDATDKTSDAARDALKQAIAIYRKPFEENPANTWHGVNLVALLARARRLGLSWRPTCSRRRWRRK